MELENKQAYLQKLQRLKELKDLKAQQSPSSSSVEEPRSSLSVTGSGLLTSAVDSLPMLGGIVGGALGTSVGPLGSVAGAGGGYALGARAKDMINQHVLDKPVEAVGLPQKLLDTGKDVLTGATGEIAGQGLTAAAPLVGAGISKGSQALSNVSNAIPDWMTAAIAGVHGYGVKKAIEVAPKIVDMTSKIIESAPPQYKAALSNAAQQGGRSFAITHFLLSGQDPAYRESTGAQNK